MWNENHNIEIYEYNIINMKYFYERKMNNDYDKIS